MDDFKTSPDDVLRLIKANQKQAAKRDRAQSLRLDQLTARVKGIYLHLGALSTLIVGDIVARYISSK